MNRTETDQHNILHVKYLLDRTENKKYLDKHISIVNRFLDNNIDEKNNFQKLYASIYVITLLNIGTVKNLYEIALNKAQRGEIEYRTVNMLFKYPIHNKIVYKTDI